MENGKNLFNFIEKYGEENQDGEKIKVVFVYH